MIDGAARKGSATMIKKSEKLEILPNFDSLFEGVTDDVAAARNEERQREID